MNIHRDRLGGLTGSDVADFFCDFSESIVAEGAITLDQAQPLMLAGSLLTALSLNFVDRHEPNPF
jgi:hypothetical protein